MLHKIHSIHPLHSAKRQGLGNFEFDKPKIISVNLVKSYLNNNRKDNFVLSIYVDNYPNKVEVEFDNKKEIAKSNLPSYGNFGYSGNFIVNLNKLIPPPYNSKEFSFVINAFDNFNNICDTKIYKVTANINGDISNGIFEEYGEAELFKKLQNSGELEPNEIKEYRKFISKLEANLKSVWYIELQKHVRYKSQRDNENPKADVMCNLTTLAMNLEFLGIGCPQLNIQFEDWLENKRVEKKYPDRTSPDSWIKLAKDLGVKSKKVDIWTKKSDSEEAIKKTLNDKIKPFLDDGNSISLSAFSISSKKGHIVKLQSINNDGIIVDDPFGRVNNFKERENGGSGYKGSKNSKNNIDIFGKDNLWRWSDVKICTIKYIVVFFKLE
jgi:hypothetical protein